MDLYGMRTWFTVFAIILAVADFIVFIGWIDAITTEIDEKKAAKNQQSKR